jgi:Fur family transcriptional regulator, ferric uptake regulator
MSNKMDAVQSAIKLLKEKGHKLTAARRVILETLLASGGHLSADELAERVRQAAPGVGRMTVYRTLDLLNDLGLIRPVYQGTGAAHYVWLHDGHHHHLVCSSCDQVIEFEDCVIEDVTDQLGRRFNFQIEGHLLELYGVCGDCSQVVN